MPTNIDTSVYSMAKGSSMKPNAISALFSTPWSARMPFHAYTLSKNEVQNGSMTPISSSGRTDGLARARK